MAFGIENHRSLDCEEVVGMSFKENLKTKIKLDRLLQKPNLKEGEIEEQMIMDYRKIN